MIILIYFLILYFHLSGCHELYEYQQPYAFAPDGYYEQESHSASNYENSDEITPQTTNAGFDFVIDVQKTMKENVDLFHKELLRKRDRLRIVCCEQVLPWKLFCKHVNTKHFTSQMQVICPVHTCAKEFKTVNHAHLHIALHQHPELLACPVCKEQFSAISVIKKHCISCWEKHAVAEKKNKFLTLYTQMKDVTPYEQQGADHHYSQINAHNDMAHSSLSHVEFYSDN